jgi:recombinational DNA repair protein (RecF pathway)
MAIAAAFIVVGIVVLVIGYAVSAAGVFPKCSRCGNPQPNGFDHFGEEHGRLCRACTRQIGARPWYCQNWMWEKMQAEKAKE